MVHDYANVMTIGNDNISGEYVCNSLLSAHTKHQDILCPHSFLPCISGWVTVNVLPPCPDKTTYIAIPRCTTHGIEQNNSFLLYVYRYSADQNERKTGQTLITPCGLASPPTDCEVL